MSKQSADGTKRTGTDTDADIETQTAAICPLCLSVTTNDDPEEVHTIAEQHNDNLHGGVRVARPVKPNRKHIEAFRNRVRRTHGERVATDVDELIAEREPWGGV